MGRVCYSYHTYHIHHGYDSRIDSNTNTEYGENGRGTGHYTITDGDDGGIIDIWLISPECVFSGLVTESGRRIRSPWLRQ